MLVRVLLLCAAILGSLSLFAQDPSPPKLLLRCTITLYEADGRRPATWAAACKVTMGEEVLFGYKSETMNDGLKALPLSVPATYDEAAKAVKRFREREVPRLLKERGYKRREKDAKPVDRGVGNS